MHFGKAMTLILALLILSPSLVAADGLAPQNKASETWALETNVMWPFFPGGITEFKLLVPFWTRGQLVVGPHADYKQECRREQGRIKILAVKVGYRQYLWRHLHVEASANVGWRHEYLRPLTAKNHDNLVISTWLFAGYQVNLSEYIYANARGGLGHISYRSDAWPGQTQGAFGAGDVNLGVYF